MDINALRTARVSLCAHHQSVQHMHARRHTCTPYYAQEFSEDYDVVAINLRGYGPSDVPTTLDAYKTPRLVVWKR